LSVALFGYKIVEAQKRFHFHFPSHTRMIVYALKALWYNHLMAMFADLFGG